MPLDPRSPGTIGRGGSAAEPGDAIDPTQQESADPMKVHHRPPPTGVRPESRLGSRPGRRWGRAGLGLAAVLAVISLAACAPDSSSASVKTVTRPTTPAKLQILSPEPNAVVGSSVDLKLQLDGATIVAPTKASGVDPAEGHIHVLLDGKIVSMTYGLTQAVPVTPGTHTIQAQFVASDHRPFANQVVAAVSFQSQ